MALLDNIQIRKSRQVRREIDRSVHPSVWIDFSDTIAATTEIPCVEVQIPERDWGKIVQLIQAHERVIQNPAVQDAWDQYVMLTHLTKTLTHR